MMKHRNVPPGTVSRVSKFADLPEGAFHYGFDESYEFVSANKFSAVIRKLDAYGTEERKLTIRADDSGEYVIWRDLAFNVRLSAEYFRKA